MSNIFLGILIGISSLIPGLSFGTIIYLFNQNIYDIILNYKKNKITIIKIIIGIIISIIVTSKVIDYLLLNHRIIFMYTIIILLSINTIKLINKNINIKYLIIGIIIIYSLFKLKINLMYINILTLLIFGFIDGLFTILPGISGSMIMMILGIYYITKDYIITFNIFPLIIYYLGDMIGLYQGTKLINKIKNNTIFNSIILGFIISSIILLIPI